MTFGMAIEALKYGRRVARAGWNGKGQFVFLIVPDKMGVNSLPYLSISTVTGDVVPWLASQTDVLATDWELA